MHHSRARRAFLEGDFHKAETQLPPGAVVGFYDLCTQCGACAQACPSQIIYRDSGGFPVINPWAGECTFCSACADVCEPKAIGPALGWDWRAKVDSDCLSVQGTTCRICEDQCGEQAIRFELQLMGRSKPLIDLDQCTGCGACIAPCPVAAVSIFCPKQQRTEVS